jgi:hypothetical protein
MAVEHKQKITLASYPPVKLYYWSKEIFEKHIEFKNEVKIYSLERTVCDIIRFEKYSGTDTMKEVCNNYLQRKDRNLDLLLKTAREINAYDKVHQVFSILI